MKPYLLIPLLSLLFFSPTANAGSGIAVMGIDLGSEWFKVAIVKPGVPMEIALNGESKRKTPTVVAIKGEDTLTGNAAMTSSLKFPQHAYKYFLSLLGKKIDSPTVVSFLEKFPHYEITADDETLYLSHADLENPVSIDQIVALTLRSAAEIAAKYAEVDKVKDCVITVPVFMSQYERERLIHVAENLADLKVLQLMNVNAAVALNFGMFRRKEFADKPKSFVIYDMGAENSIASVVEIKNDEKTKDPTAHILGISWDRSLGGLEFDVRIQKFLREKFEEANPKLAPVTKHRALAKLLKEAQRVRQVLSANANTLARIENLTGDDVDLKVEINRDDLNNLCSDLYDRVLAPVEKAIEMSGLDKEIGASEILLYGGLTRTPMIKEKLESAGFTLSSSINSDEAAAIGASYKAADLSAAFRVKPFAVKNAIPYQIQAEFDRTVTDDEGNDKVKHSKRVLFAPGNSYPQKKVLTFNKYSDDFNFVVNYGLSSEYKHLTNDVEYFNLGQFSEISVSGVASALEDHKEASSQGIKVHFDLNESGLFSFKKVEHLFEEQKLIEEKKKEDKKDDKDKKEADDIFSKLGDLGGMNFENLDPDMIKKMQESMKDFDPEKIKVVKPGDIPNEEDEKEIEGEEKAEESPETEPETDKADSEKEEESEDKAKESEKKDGEEEKAKEGEEDKEKVEEEKKPKYRKVKRTVNLKSESTIKRVASISQEKLTVQKKFLTELHEKEVAKRKREVALNELESFIYDKQDKLDLEGYSECATETEKEEIRALLSSASDWLWDVEEPTALIYRSKLDELEKATKAWITRSIEKSRRGEIIKVFDEQFNHTQHILAAMKKEHAELPEDDRPFTDDMIKTLEDKLKETIDWKNETVAKQETMEDTEEPVLNTVEAGKRAAALQRESDFLIKKRKTWRPKPPKKEEKKEEKKEDKEEDAKSDESKNEDDSKKEEDPTTETGDDNTTTSSEETPVHEEL